MVEDGGVEVLASAMNRSLPTKTAEPSRVASRGGTWERVDAPMGESSRPNHDQDVPSISMPKTFNVILERRARAKADVESDDLS